jgi:AmmeMemoRadiSam system protein A
MKIDQHERRALLQIARDSIEHGLDAHQPLTVDTLAIARALRVPAACFVTLKREGQLRGCIGSLEAQEPLVRAVADAAFSAAFGDPRFPPLSREELADLEIEISVLSPLQAVDVSSERELLELLRPGVDGLVLSEGQRRSTFLPAVWEMLPRPRDFVRQLKAKGGWLELYWSPEMKAQRFQTESFGETELAGE